MATVRLSREQVTQLVDLLTAVAAAADTGDEDRYQLRYCRSQVRQLMPDIEPGPAVEQELIEFCKAHLAHFKCPRSVDFEPELPRLPTGKLYKRLLRDRYWAGHTTSIV